MTLDQALDKSVARPDAYSYADSLVTLSDPMAQGAEYIRALRTHIMAQHMDLGRRALAICEAGPGLGATFVATNLAVSLAQAGVKTLLIDGDLRRPMVQRVVRPAVQTPGLRECLSNAGSLAGDFIQESVLPNFSVMFAGGIANNAQELLAGTTFERVMNSCLRDFDMTVIDTPPANSCADCRRIGSVAAYSLIVSRRHKGLVSDAKVLAAQLLADHSTVVGTVMNDA